MRLGKGVEIQKQNVVERVLAHQELVRVLKHVQDHRDVLLALEDARQVGLANVLDTVALHEAHKQKGGARGFVRRVRPYLVKKPKKGANTG